MNKNLIFAITLCALLQSCGTGKRGADTDTTAATAAIEAAETETRLPDTALPSTDVLKYNVEIRDTTVGGELSTLKDLYADAPGTFIFRGSPRRDAPKAGRLDGTPSDITVDWSFTTESDPKWGGGSGWTGQPAVVTWRAETVKRLKEAGIAGSDFSGTEVLVGSLGCYVYGIDYETGKASREPIDVGNPIKGAISLDPTLNGNLYVGHGINNKAPFGAITINLLSNKTTHQFGQDPGAQRSWGAYDSNAIRVGDFVFRPGENGTFYKWHIPADGIPRLHSLLRYTKGGEAPGIESSLAVYRNYGYFGDNAGNILCVNLDTMRPVWWYDNHDDTDATPVVTEEEGKAYVYVGNEVDKQGNGKAYFTKLDALTGEKVWERAFEAKSEVKQTELRTKHFDGGFYTSPLPGRGDASGLIFTTVVLNNSGQNGDAVALDRKTGEVVWQTPLKHYAWSSPIALMGPNDKMYVFQLDTYGNAYVIDGQTGKILVTKSVGANFESSPVVVGKSSVVVGSRGDKIIRMTVK